MIVEISNHEKNHYFFYENPVRYILRSDVPYIIHIYFSIKSKM